MLHPQVPSISVVSIPNFLDSVWLYPEVLLVQTSSVIWIHVPSCSSPCEDLTCCKSPFYLVISGLHGHPDIPAPKSSQSATLSSPGHSGIGGWCIAPRNADGIFVLEIHCHLVPLKCMNGDASVLYWLVVSISLKNMKVS